MITEEHLAGAMTHGNSVIILNPQSVESRVKSNNEWKH